ncbi:Ig-like domain-containing protein, partial [Vibrio mediterranei]|nr:Ig-like domain-containing protein [Vibrio mediterranei]
SQLSVAKGQTQPLTANAIYSDGTSSVVSNSVTWTSYEPQTATVTPAGLLSGNEVGTTTVEAFIDGVTSNTVNVEVTDAIITAITVTPSQLSVAKGQTQPLTANAIYSDGTSSVVSNSVTWTSNEPQTATVTPAGLLSGNEVGTTTVEAFLDGVTSNTVNVEVTDAIITAITVTPSQLSVAKGQTQPLTANAIYSDGTSSVVSNSVTWTSNEPQTATVTPAGLLSGNEVGTTTVEAFLDGVTSNTVNVEVTDAIITAITVTPSQLSVAKGQTQPLTANAIYSDGTSSVVSNSVTWTSYEPQTATVTPAGLLSGNEVGTTTVEAFLDGVTSNTVNVNIHECSLTGSSCVDTFDSGSGVLFTNSPSKTFLDNIGGSANNGFTQEIFSKGPVGDFYWFYWDNANLLCDTYNSKNIAGRTNWRLPTLNELRGLFNTHGNMFTARGWAVRIKFWTSTGRGPGFEVISLANGNSGPTMPDIEHYASCVSVP